MKFKNLDKMKVLTDKEMGTLLGGDCKSCSKSCKKACSQGQKVVKTAAFLLKK